MFCDTKDQPDNPAVEGLGALRQGFGLPAQKTLCVSDLDGTLLAPNAALSTYTVNALNRLIARGIHFSVATARTAATVVYLLEQVAINMPIVLMNGVLVYDMAAKKYVKKEILPKEKTVQILCTMKKTKQTGLMYSLSGDTFITYYEPGYNGALQNSVEERERDYHKKLVLIDDFATVDTDILYFCFIDTHENVSRLHAELKKISGIRIEMYEDVYSGGTLWFMEVFNNIASKYTAVQFLREQYGFDRVIGFGDNLNDLPLFAACDEGYAVANARPELKEKATAVIDANYADGVAKWLEINAI